MQTFNPKPFLRDMLLWGGCLGLLTVAFTNRPTLQDTTSIAMVYLLAVVASAYFSNFVSACFTSIASFFLTNYFFIDPRYTLQKDTSYVDQAERIAVKSLGAGFWQITLSYGFMESADIPLALSNIQLEGEPIDPFTNSYFLSRDIIVPDAGGAMTKWRDHLFALLSRNATSAADYFHIPNNSVIELGSRIQI